MSMTYGHIDVRRLIFDFDWRRGLGSQDNALQSSMPTHATNTD